MLKTMTSFFSALVLSVVSLFALYTPSASAATLEWTGGGADLNFSTPENWSGGVVPVDGDDLVFDNDVFNFGDFDAPNIPNNDLDAVTFGSITTQGAGGSQIAIEGNDFSLSGGISAASSIEVRTSITLTADQTFDGYFRSSFSEATKVDVGIYTLTTSTTAATSELASIGLYGLSGTGNVIVTGMTIVDYAEEFTGSVSVQDASGLQIRQVPVLSAASIAIENGSEATFCTGGDYEIGQDMELAGDGLSSFWPGALRFFTSCGSGGPGVPPASTVTVSGTVSLTGNASVVVPQNRTVVFQDVVKNGFELTLSSESQGEIIVDGEAQTPEQKTVTIESNDIQPGLALTVASNETVIVNGERGLTDVLGILMGNGKLGQVQVYGGTVAPGLSPGCLEVSSIEFQSAGSTYQVEIAGTEACTGYDQIQVEDGGNVSFQPGVILDVSFLDNYSPNIGDSFVIILNNSETDVIGTFDGLAEGAELVVNGVTFTISYEGGDGNDVVLTVTDAPAPAPDAPDTGFALVMANPIVTLLVSIASAATLFMIARRQFSNKH